MLDRLYKFFSSLRLTVCLLAFGIVLVFIGTIAQADEGLYYAQARYFKQWWIWGITMFGHKIWIPYPGGYLIGFMLLINLAVAYHKRFELSKKKTGIYLAHTGIILLLLGQLITDLAARETQLRLVDGQTKNYSESGSSYELAFKTDADAENEDVVAIPEKILTQGGDVKFANLPFTVRIKEFWPNTDLAFRAPMAKNDPPLTTNGVAAWFDFKSKPETRKMDDKNVPTAIVEIASPAGSLGTWAATGWAGDEVMTSFVHAGYREQMGPKLADTIYARLTEPQVIQAGNKTFTMVMRPSRVYKPYSMTLLKATHTDYLGTDNPKDFRSRVRIQNPQTHEDREVEIYMNNPLRYDGSTFYQSQMGRDEFQASRGVTTLQVVRNPGWLTPYAACIMVASGLAIQFLIHLVGFISKRRTA
jgi:hypothetical protein